MREQNKVRMAKHETLGKKNSSLLSILTSGLHRKYVILIFCVSKEPHIYRYSWF